TPGPGLGKSWAVSTGVRHPTSAGRVPDTCLRRRPGRAAWVGPSVVLVRVHAGKQHFGEAELGEVLDPRRVQAADEVVAFVLHHARMEAFRLALDALAVGVQAA